MTSRERFHETFRYGKPDRVFLMSQWAFNETRQRWLREGMPAQEHYNAHFGFDRMETIPINNGPWPQPEVRLV